MFHCGACSRPVSVRWTRCWFCRAPTGVPRSPGYALVDHALNSFRIFTVSAGVWLAVGAWMLWQMSAAAGAAGTAFTVVFVLAHLAAPMHLVGWRAAAAAWAVLFVIASAFALRSAWFVLPAVGPLAVLAWMLRANRRVGKRLAGRALDESAMPKSEVPVRGPCVDCGSHQSKVVAPLFCASLLHHTVRWPGVFESRCDRHARRVAWGATIFCACFGWWGIPWGPLLTGEAIRLNLAEGGVQLDAPLLRELRQREELTGSAVDEAGLVTDFGLGAAFGGLCFAAACACVSALG